MDRSTSIGVLIGGAVGAAGCAAASALDILLAPVAASIGIVVLLVSASLMRRRIELVLSIVSPRRDAGVA